MRARFISFASLRLASLFWGASFVFGKIALSQLPFTQLLALRFVLASVLFVPWLVKGRPRGPEWGWFLLAAFLTVPATFLLQFGGLSITSASHASLLIGVVPAVMVGVSLLVFRQRVPIKDAAASMAAVAGVLLIVCGRGSDGRIPSLVGDLLVLASTLAIVGWILAQRRLLKTFPVRVVTPWVTVLGTAMLLPVGFLGKPLPLPLISLGTWLAVGGLALFPTVLRSHLATAEEIIEKWRKLEERLHQFFLAHSGDVDH